MFSLGDGQWDSWHLSRRADGKRNARNENQVCVKGRGKIEQTKGIGKEKVVVVGGVCVLPWPKQRPAGHAEVRRLERRTQGREGAGCVSLNRSPHSQPSGKWPWAGAPGWLLVRPTRILSLWLTGVFHVDSSRWSQMSDSAALAGCLYLANYCSRALCCLAANPWERSHGLSVRGGIPLRRKVIDKHVDWQIAVAGVCVV